MLINTLSKYVSPIRTLGYADDLRSIDKCHEQQNVVNRLEDWSQLFGPEVKVGKTVVMTHARIMYPIGQCSFKEGGRV